MNVTLGLIFVASHRKEWPMTFIAVHCPHCQSDQIVKRGKTARGTQRSLAAAENTRILYGGAVCVSSMRPALSYTRRAALHHSFSPSLEERSTPRPRRK